MPRDYEVWLQYLIGPLAIGIVMALVGYLLARPDKRTEQTHDDLQTIIETLQAELERKTEENLKKDEAIEKRNTELQASLHTIEKLRLFIERKKWEVWTYRRDRAEVLKAQQQLKVVLEELRSGGMDVLECCQIVEMVIVKLSQDIQVPDGEELKN